MKKRLLPVRKNLDDCLQSAKDDAFNLLSYRERSENELKKRLLRKGHKRAIINQVIARLKDLDYLNDKRFAEMWIRDRIANKPRGRYYLKKELKNKGVKPAVIASVLNKLLTDGNEKEMAERLANKWLKSHSIDKYNEAEYFLRLKRYLRNKGFSFDLVNIVVLKIEKNQ
ncbi:regulatory protein RecX [Halocella sp. SP3-1]|nr:regulatory protein RecX [Halocella sp. SP3-1]